MSCPAEAIVMNYSLGRTVSAEDRAHLARCKKCRKTLARLEGGALAEGLQMQGQASTFGPGASVAVDRVDGDAATGAASSAALHSGW